MTALPERAAETALEDLTDRAILISGLESQTYYLPPLAAQFIKARRPEAVSKTGIALVNGAYALAMKYGGQSKDYEKFPILEAEWEFISAALPRLLEGDNDRLQAVCEQIFYLLYFSGRLDELLWLYQQSEVRALAANNQERAGWCAYRAGGAYLLRKQYDKVLLCANRVAEYWQESSLRCKAIAISLRGQAHELSKNYPEAIVAYRESLEIVRSISPESDDVAVALNDLAGVETTIKDYNAAERDYYEAIRIAKNVDFLEGASAFTNNLAAVKIDRKQWIDAESLACEALVLAEKIGGFAMIAKNCHCIAIALLKQNRNLEEAANHARRAIEIYTYLRVLDDLQNAQQTLAEIEKAMSGE
ncbi:tetratricopeptide repeat protein [Chlorobaculum limnaeum]